MTSHHARTMSIESYAPGPYLRLFARTQREGWTSWGDEAPAADEVAA